jgi:hypothetical protein
VGWFVGAALRDRYQRRGGVKTPMALTWTYFASQGIVVATPVVVAWVLVMLARGSTAAWHSTSRCWTPPAHLIGAYVIVRIGVLLFAASLGNKSWMQHWETRVALVIWLAIAAEYLHWLDPIITTLDSIGMAAGKSRITVWSVSEAAVHVDVVRVGGRLDQPLGRTAPEETQQPRALHPHRHREIRQCVLDRPQHSHGPECRGRRPDRVDRAHRRHRLGLGFGLQSIAANFVSGFVLLMDRSIKPGDVISLSGQSAPAPRTSAGCRNCAAAMWWCATATAWKCWCRISS